MRRSILDSLSVVPMEKVLDELWQSRPAHTGSVLAIDVMENEDLYTIKAAVPGYKSDDVELTVEDGCLVITATKQSENESKMGNYLRRELISGDVYRRIALPRGVDLEGISAEFQDGVLSVSIPKHKAVKSRIEIKSANTAKDAKVLTNKN